MDQVKKVVLKAALPVLLQITTGMLSKENFRKYGSALFSLCRDYVTDTETQIDDKIALPILDALEEMLGL